MEILNQILAVIGIIAISVIVGTLAGITMAKIDDMLEARQRGRK